MSALHPDQMYDMLHSCDERTEEKLYKNMTSDQYKELIGNIFDRSGIDRTAPLTKD